MKNGKGYRLLSVASVLAASISLSGCLQTFVAGQVGSRVGTGFADALPAPAANTVVKPGGNACDVLRALGWPTVPLKGVDGSDALLAAIGATVETARKCPK